MARSGTNQFLELCKTLSAAQIGNLVTEYLHESIHGGWEGYLPSQVKAIDALMADMHLYYQHASDPGHFDRPGFSGADPYNKG